MLLATLKLPPAKPSVVPAAIASAPLPSAVDHLRLTSCRRDRCADKVSVPTFIRCTAANFCDGRAQIVAADRERLAAEKVTAQALD